MFCSVFVCLVFLFSFVLFCYVCFVLFRICVLFSFSLLCFVRVFCLDFFCLFLSCLVVSFFLFVLFCVVSRPGSGLGLSSSFLYSSIGMVVTTGVQLELHQYNFIRNLRRSYSWFEVAKQFDRVAFYIPIPDPPLFLSLSLTLPLFLSLTLTLPLFLSLTLTLTPHP
jgi:hypothetical protein